MYPLAALLRQTQEFTRLELSQFHQGTAGAPTALSLVSGDGAPGETGSRTVDVYSSREDAGDDVWTRHATGFLSATPPARGAGYDFTAWPPPGGQRVEVGDFYTELVERPSEELSCAPPRIRFASVGCIATS